MTTDTTDTDTATATATATATDTDAAPLTLDSDYLRARTALADGRLLRHADIAALTGRARATVRARMIRYSAASRMRGEVVSHVVDGREIAWPVSAVLAAFPSLRTCC